MATQQSQRLEDLVPGVTPRMLLRGAMRRDFPEQREEILRCIEAFAETTARYGYDIPDAKSLMHVFNTEFGLPEFQAAWYILRIGEAAKRRAFSR